MEHVHTPRLGRRKPGLLFIAVWVTSIGLGIAAGSITTLLMMP